MESTQNKNDGISRTLLDILNGSLRGRMSAFDNTPVPKSKADLILQSYKIGNLSPRLKPSTSPFNFNLPDILRDYLEFRCSTTSSNMTKYLIDIIQNDMDNLPVTGKETPLSELCKTDPELAEKAIRFTIGQFERLGCLETTVVDENKSKLVTVNKEGRMRFDLYNDPYGDLSKSIRSMAMEGEHGITFDSVICHPDLQEFVRMTVKGTPWEAVEVITMPIDILRYNIMFMKNYRTEIFGLKKSDELMKKKEDEHGEYFYDDKSLKEWMLSKNEKEEKVVEKKYRVVECISKSGESVFEIEEQTGKLWLMTGKAANSLEEAKAIVEQLRSDSTIKKVIHEL